MSNPFEPDPALGPLNDSFKWFLASLPFDATPSAIKQFFSSFGAVNFVKVIYDNRTQKSKGYGFLFMLDSTGDSEVEQFARSHNNRIQLMGKSNVLLQRHDHSRAQPIRKPGKQSHDDHVPVLGLQQPGPPMTTALPPRGGGGGSHYGPASSAPTSYGGGGPPPPGPRSGGPPSYGGGGGGYPQGGMSSYGPASSSSSYGYQEPPAAGGSSYGNPSSYVMGGGGGGYPSMTGGYSGDSYSGAGYSTGGSNYYAADSSGQYGPPQAQNGASYGGYSNQGASYGGVYSGGGTGYDSQQQSGYSGYASQQPPVPPPQQPYATNSSYGPPHQPLPPPVRAPPPRQPVSTKIFLQNLPIDVTPKDVVQFLMKQHSVNVRRCTMEYDSDPNVHYCYAHIDVASPGEASRLVDESAQGLLKFLNGSILTASFDSRPPPETSVSIPVPGLAPPAPRPMSAGRGRGSRPLSREGRRNVSRPY